MNSLRSILNSVSNKARFAAIPCAAKRSYKSISKPLKTLILLCILSCANLVLADSVSQAKRMHERIAGIPPSSETLLQMTALIDEGNALGAAHIALQSPAFYNVTLKNWVTPWTNEAFDVFAPLNDYTATVIGMVRDDIDFRLILSGDILYTANTSAGAPAYSVSNNLHYESLESSGADLSLVLQQTTQSALSGLPPQATAGVITTRAAAKSFLKTAPTALCFASR